MSDHGRSPPGSSGGPREVDVLLVHGITDDGAGVKVIRQRGDRLEAGSVVPVRDGQPLHGDLVKLRPRPERPMLFDVEVQYEHRASSTDPEPEASEPPAAPRPGPAGASPPRVGPARIANQPYRRGWDRIWGPSGKKPLSN